MELLAAQLRSSINAPLARSPDTMTESFALLSILVTLDGHCAFTCDTASKITKIGKSTFFILEVLGYLTLKFNVTVFGLPSASNGLPFSKRVTLKE